MSKVAIVSHSGFGHTQKVAEILKTVLNEQDNISAEIYDAKTVANDLDQLDEVDMIIFGSPTYMGGPSAEFKAFADASSEKWFTQSWKDKLAAGFTNAGSLCGDKLATLQYFNILANQHSMIWVSQGIMGTGTNEGHGAKPDDINRMGSYMGLMTQSDNAEPDQTPSPGDIETTKLFGERITKILQKWTKA